MRSIVGLLLLLGACTPCAAKLDASDAALAERASYRIELSSPNGTNRVFPCESTATAPRKITFAHHCLALWSGVSMAVSRDGVWRPLNPETLKCSTADISDAFGAGRDLSHVHTVDGVCEVELAEEATDFESFVPSCLGQWPEGASAALVVNRGQRVALAVCNDGRDGSAVHGNCTGNIELGDSGAGAVVGGCLAGVLVGVQTANLVAEQSLIFSELNP